MKKNKLYTVNKGLASVLQKQVEPSHLFDDGGYKAGDYFSYYMNNLNKPTLEGLVDLSKPVNFAGSLPSFTGKPAIPTTPIIPNTPTSGGFSLSNIGSGVLGAVGGAVGNLAYKGLSGGLSSGAGKAINSVGNLAGSVLSNVPGVGKLAGPAVQIASGIVGGGVNALVGTKVDEEKLSEAKAGTAAYNNFTSSASTMDNIQGPQAQAAVEDAYKGGALKKGWAREKNQAIRNARVDAKNFAFNSVKNNIDTINKDQLNDDLANYVAFGGPLDFGGGALGLMQQNKYLDAINKRSDVLGTKFQGTVPQGTLFADGGATTAFMDDFGSDPIGAAIRYRNSMEQLQAQKEAEAVEAQREQEYLNMQQRLANLETQNQGLQALLGSQANDINTLRSMQPVESFDEGRKEQMMQEAEAIANTAGKYVGDTADKNKVWQYVKKRLKDSGRFNDIQIEGIKYNLQRESALNPDAVGDHGTAIGLAQWRGNRQPKDRSLEGQVEHLINTLSTYDGKDHWIGRDNFNGFMNARTPEEAHYYIAKGWERPADSILAKVKNISDMSLRRINAFGGELGTNGTDFTNGLLQVNVGNSHEKNPLGGVPMGVDAEGVPNLVEEGETVFNDYVFSNRMKVPKFMYNELGLGGNLNFKKGKKNKGITFAEASKKLAKESEQRPNDPISAAGLNASLSKLAEIQETERMKKQAEEQMGLEYAYGGALGNVFDGNGNRTNSLSGETQEQRAARARANNARNRAISRQYFNQAPTLSNLWNGLSYWYNSVPILGGENEEGLDLQTGVAPSAGWKGQTKVVTAANRGRQAYNTARAKQATDFARSAKPTAAKASGVTKSAGTDYVSGTQQQAAANTAQKGNAWTSAQPFEQTGYPNQVTSRAFPRIASRNTTMRGADIDIAGLSKAASGNNTLRTALGIGAGVVGAAGLGLAGLYGIGNNSQTGVGGYTPPNLGLGDYGVSLNDPYTQYLMQNLPTEETSADTSVPTSSARTTGSSRTQSGFRSSNNAFGPDVDAGSGITFTPNPDNILDYKIAEEEKKKELTPEEIKALNEASGVKDENAYLNNVNTDNVDNPNLNYDPYPTWMRYAPVVGAGMMTLTDALGLTNRPDYSYANRLEAAANSAAFAPNVRFNPIGDYMRNQHFDRMFYANQMQANSNAVNRILRSYSSPSKAANIILNGYNTLNALGNLDRQAEEYDRAVYERTKDFNRKTNMFNSQGDLEAQIANARFNQQAKQFGLSGLAQAAALRDSIDQRVGAARAANLNNFLTSLGNIGRENFALNQINSDRSRNYGVYNNGVSEHKKSSRGKKGSRWF